MPIDINNREELNGFLHKFEKKQNQLRRLIYGMDAENFYKAARAVVNDDRPCNLSWMHEAEVCAANCGHCIVRTAKRNCLSDFKILFNRIPENYVQYYPAIKWIREHAPDGTAFSDRRCEISGVVDDLILSGSEPEAAAISKELFDRYMVPCNLCDKFIIRENSIPVIGFGNVCPECLGGMVSSSHVHQCDNCDRYTMYWESVDGRTLCRDCFDESYYHCDNCGHVIHASEAHVTNHGTYCENCFEQNRYANYVRNYTYKPRPVFHGATPPALFMGVELETSKRGGRSRDQSKFSSNLCDINPNEDLFYQKRDASIDSDIGIEIVTHPCTLDYHLHEFPWDEIIATAKENSYRSHDDGRCGLHVHVSRNALGDTPGEYELNTAKLLVLVESIWRELYVFSRRHEDELDRWAGLYPVKRNLGKGNDLDLYFLAKNLQDEGHEERYHAINLENDSTVEFRIFRGSLNKQTIFACLELVKIMCDYTMSHTTAELQNTKWSDIRAAGANYPEFMAYIQTRRGLTEGTEIPVIEEVPEREDFE